MYTIGSEEVLEQITLNAKSACSITKKANTSSLQGRSRLMSLPEQMHADNIVKKNFFSFITKHIAAYGKALGTYSKRNVYSTYCTQPGLFLIHRFLICSKNPLSCFSRSSLYSYFGTSTWWRAQTACNKFIWTPAFCPQVYCTCNRLGRENQPDMKAGVLVTATGL